MRHRMTIIITAVFVLCIAASIGLTIYGRSLVIDTGIEEFTDIDAIAKADIQLEYVLARDYEPVLLQLLDMEDSELKGILDQSTSILVVEPVGGICQYTNSFSQEMTVKKVIQSNDPDVCEGSTLRIFRALGMKYANKMISYSDLHSMNILYPGNEYLVFLTASLVQDYSKTLDFEFTDFPVPAVNVDRSHAGEICPSYDFNECRDVLYVASTEKLGDMYNQFETRLLDLYIT